MKTEEDIAQDIYDLIDKSFIMENLTGKLYKNGKRPANSQKEDVVITILSNEFGQTQQAFVNVNVYFKDITIDVKTDGIVTKQYEKDSKRAKFLCRLFQDFFESVIKEYFVRLETQRVTELEGEHVITNRLFYKFYNE